jgi:HEAT repeat protein
MPKLEERLEGLRQLRSVTPDDSTLSVLRKSLGDRANLVVAEAAKVAAELHLASLIPDLLTAFDRLFQNPVRNDPKCWGKKAIVTALSQLEFDESTPFLRGAKHVQMEPVWGGQEDSAVQLRATSVLGLVQCADLSRVEVLRQLVDAMTDSADPVRLEAIRALEQMNGEEAVLLLRLKARVGDARPVVTGQVFDALLKLEPGLAVGFLSQFLHSDDAALRDEAALALGSSRSSEAASLLIDVWKATSDREFAAVLLRSLSSSRQPTAIDFLLELVRSGMTRDAVIALDALKIHQNSHEIWDRVEQARRERSDEK